jgi:hypothetical protein
MKQDLLSNFAELAFDVLGSSSLPSALQGPVDALTSSVLVIIDLQTFQMSDKFVRKVYTSASFRNDLPPSRVAEPDALL